jgi:hypothetical protein
MNHNLGMLAEIHRKLGQPMEVLAAVDEALKCGEKVGESFYNAELHRETAPVPWTPEMW